MIAGLLGVAFSAWMGWMNSNEPFEPKKFSKSLAAGITTLVAALIAFLLLEEPVRLIDYFFMFASTAGIEIMVHRGSALVSPKK